MERPCRIAYKFLDCNERCFKFRFTIPRARRPQAIPPRGGLQVFTGEKVDALNRFQKERQLGIVQPDWDDGQVYKDWPFAYTKLLLNSDRGVAP